MSLPIVFRPEARAEFDAAADWYEQQRPGLGVDFIERVQDMLDLIAAQPLTVIAVFHSSRNPSIWQGRI